ncbi:MAG: VTC domain-containing protein [Proteobacteria bacterium]|nr:VTC domain-containing protein [Pseudomonadota bacterium]
MEQYELKFWLSESGSLQLEHALIQLGERCVFDRDRPVAFAYTTYLDTDDGHFFHADGSVTSRLRVREYAAARRLDETPIWTGLCYLEYKHRWGALRQKHRWNMSQIAARGIVAALRNGDDPLRSLARLDRVPAWSRELRRATLRPFLCTWYRCTTFRLGAARVTIDRDISFSAPFPDHRPPWAVAPFDQRSSCIVEIKCCDLRALALLSDALADAGAMTLRASKYQLAVQAAQRRGLAVPSRRASG